MNLAKLDELMCAALRGEEAVWPSAHRDDVSSIFIDRAEYHGVTALLHERSALLSGWPASVRNALRTRALAQTCWELQHQQCLNEIMAALRRKAIEPVFFKGTALAYGLYVNPVWRARGDTDMIVPEVASNRAAKLLVSLDFRPDIAVGGDLVTYQQSYTWDCKDRGRHMVDLHRRINNSELLSHLFSYAELRAEAQGLPQLCEGALAVGPVHALLLACLHPATHKHNPYTVDGISYYGGDRIIWYYDVHLLAQSFTDCQWQDFLDKALAKGLCAISREGLEHASARFGTRYPDFVRQALAKTGEPVAAYLHAGWFHQSWIDFCSIPDFSNRVRFLRELGFPSQSYMRTKYADSPGAWLPWLYARRAAEGLMKRVRYARQDH